MTVAARLTGVGTFFAYDYDETVVAKFRIGSDGTAYSNEFDENTASTLTGTKRMSATSTGGLIVLDSINEIDPVITTVPTSGLLFHVDAATSTKTETAPVGQQAYTSSGTFTFTVPAGCTSISAVCIGGGGGGGGSDARSEGMQGGAGGALCYGTIPVTPGESLTVTVGNGGNGGGQGNNGSNGGNTSITRGATALLTANGGNGGQERSTGSNGQSTYTIGATVTNSGGGNGGGCNGSASTGGSGGGGAGGYSGAGGTGGGGTTGASAGSGGGGGGGGHTTSGLGAGGGGVGILGTTGQNGSAGTSGSTPTGGGGGSGGTAGTRAPGGTYGGGGGGYAANANGSGGNGGGGAVRIIWGSGRSYPSTSVADQATVTYSFTLSNLGSAVTDPATSQNGAYWLSTNSGIIFLDGSDDYMTVPLFKGIVGTGARTSIIWFKTNALNVGYRLFGWGNLVAAGYKWSVDIDTITYKLRCETSNGAFITAGSTTPSLADGRWHMVAASAPASGTVSNIKLYVDGNLLTDISATLGSTAINTAGGSPATGVDVSFGASQADVAPGYLNGNVAAFLVYNVQLTDLEIKQVYRTILNRFV